MIIAKKYIQEKKQSNTATSNNIFNRSVLIIYTVFFI